MPRWSFRIALCLAVALTQGCSGSTTAPHDAGSRDRAPGEGIGFPDGAPDARRDVGAADGPAPDAPPPAGQPCSDAAYAGWRCLTLSQTSPRHGGASFGVAVRWNLGAQAPKASALWLMGGTGSGKFRVEFRAQTIQDDLAQVDQIRSVELEFTDAPDPGLAQTGGWFRSPRQGYPDAAWVYAQVVARLQQQAVIAGAWVTHIGISNGSMMGATALARHGLGASIRRYILLGGPFAAELGPECTQTASHLFMGAVTGGAPDMRGLQDLWNGWSQPKYCASGAAMAVPSYDARSLLGSGAGRSYPTASLMVLIGDVDEFGPWILASNEHWYSLVSAGSKRRFVIDGLGHLALGLTGQPATPQVLQAASLVYEHARRPPLSEPTAAPAVIFAKTAGGPAAASFTQSDTLYGRVSGIGAAAQACMEHESQRGLCTRLSGWSKMPNGDWSFDSATKTWSCAVALSAFPKGTYVAWWRDSATGQHSERATLVLQ